MQSEGSDLKKADNANFAMVDKATNQVWRFTTADARIKLISLYPKIEF